MASPTGSNDIQATSSDCNPPQKPQNNSENAGDVATNGGDTCSSSVGAKSLNILRPSVFSSSSAARSSMPTPTFGACVSSSNFGNTSQFGSSSQKNPFSLKPSVFGSTFGFEKDAASKRPITLRPSQLEPIGDSPVSSTTSPASSSFVLSPPKLNNPLLKTDSGSEENSCNSVSSTSLTQSRPIHSSNESEKEKTSNSSSESSKVSFVPLANSTTSSGHSQPQPPPASNSTSSVSSFVFGQNLLDRVEVPTETLRSDTDSDGVSNDASTCRMDASNTNGTVPEMLFTSVIKKELPDKLSEIGSDEKKRKSLSEAAREYEESRAVKRKYDEVTVKTGEEEEINILQINCKLFAFNKDKSTWVERGRGTLRLNDLSADNKSQSRVVMRVSGSLRVVLNTKIWAEMAVDKPSEKSVRITAMDNSGEIKVFLIMASVKEVDQLFKALEWRVNNQKKLVAASEKKSDCV